MMLAPVATAYVLIFLCHPQDKHCQPKHKRKLYNSYQECLFDRYQLAFNREGTKWLPLELTDCKTYLELMK